MLERVKLKKTLLSKEEEMKKKIFSVLLAGLLTIVSLTGCSALNDAIQESEQEIEETKEQLAKDVQDIPEIKIDQDALDAFAKAGSLGTVNKDRAGNDITVPEKVEKIVSMSPSTTELLIDLGLADKIIAIDTYSASSPFASKLKADLPAFDMMAPDCESIIALNPDVIFTTGMSSAHGDDVYASVKAAGVCVADIPTAASIQDIEDDITFFGDVTKTQDKAKAINDQIEAFKKSLNETSGKIAEKKTVLYVMSVPTADYPNCYTCGKGTYMDEIFTLCGLKNIAGDVDNPWPALSEEDIIAKNPDVIIVGDTYTPDAANALMSIAAWKDIKAVKDKAVYAIDGDAFNQPNQYVMNSAYDIAVAAYPDEFKGIEKPFK